MNVLPFTTKRQFVRCFTSIALGILPWSCVNGSRLITIASSDRRVVPPSYGSKDYPQALSAILSVMSRDLKLPAVELSVTLYPSQQSFEQGVLSDAEKDFEQLRKRLGPFAKTLNMDQYIAGARAIAVSSDAIGKHNRILINEWRLEKYGWPEWIRVLAHELAHTVEFAVADGRPALWERWLTEGFGDWVGYKVLDLFGAETFVKSIEQRRALIANARGYQTFPALTQLATGADWLTWSRTLGREATYGQALLAVDFLIEQKGLPAVLEHVRLFRKSLNREQNFVAAFGESESAFDEKFSKHLALLLGR